MGRTKKQKAAAAKDEPGPDDYIFLAVFFPIGRSAAPLAREEDETDVQAAQRIGRWMHEAGLPIRKLFSRKSDTHIIVEVRKEVPEEVINSKLGAYRWVDTIADISKIPAESRDCETTVLRARVKSHDAIDKMGGMVYFHIDPIIPTGPRSESPFKTPFPKPKRIGYREPSTFSSMIQYYPLPPEFTPVEEFSAELDIKPDIKPVVEPANPPVNLEVKPEIKPNVSGDLHQGIYIASANLVPDSTPTKASNSNGETKFKPEADIKPKAEELLLRPNWDMNPSAEERAEQDRLRTEDNLETKPKVEEAIRPNWDMNPSAEERSEQEKLRVKHEEHNIRPNWDMNPSVEERVKQEVLRAEFEAEEPSELDPSEQNGTPPAPTDAPSREPEVSPRVKSEPGQPLVVQKRPAEVVDRQERG
ncbi:unnamed protein product, partial [Rhizoctonia solani]